MSSLENEGFEVHEGSRRSEQNHGVHAEGEIGQREEADTRLADEWLESDDESHTKEKIEEFKVLQEQQEADEVFSSHPNELARSVASGADRINLDKYFPEKDHGIDPIAVKHRPDEEEKAGNAQEQSHS